MDGREKEFVKLSVLLFGLLLPEVLPDGDHLDAVVADLLHVPHEHHLHEALNPEAAELAFPTPGDLAVSESDSIQVAEFVNLELVNVR